MCYFAAETIGLNKIDEAHYGTDGALRGCINDAKGIRALAQLEGFEAPDSLIDEKAIEDPIHRAVVQSNYPQDNSGEKGAPDAERLQFHFEKTQEAVRKFGGGAIEHANALFCQLGELTFIIVACRADACGSGAVEQSQRIEHQP